MSRRPVQPLLRAQRQRVGQVAHWLTVICLECVVAQVLANDQATLDAVLRAFEAFQQMLTDVYHAGSTPASR